MSYEELFSDLKAVEAQPPIVPQGDYNAVISSWTIETVETREGDQREVLRISLTYQNNPGVFLSDGVTPLDGQTAQYSIFLPNEADKHRPSLGSSPPQSFQKTFQEDFPKEVQRALNGGLSLRGPPNKSPDRKGGSE